jgi:hypothetical protein
LQHLSRSFADATARPEADRTGSGGSPMCGTGAPGGIERWREDDTDTRTTPIRAASPAGRRKASPTILAASLALLFNLSGCQALWGFRRGHRRGARQVRRIDPLRIDPVS